MKLSFSTLGCPDWTFSEIFSTASDLGYDGIEIRGIADEIYAPKIDVFSTDKLDGTKNRLKEAKIEIPILTTGAYLMDNPSLKSSEFEVKDYVLLAQKLGVPYVRVLIEKNPDPQLHPSDYEIAAAGELYANLCEFALNNNVTLLTETNGFLADTSLLASFMEKYGGNGGLIWDVHHPYRFFAETPDVSFSNIGKYVKHVHVKDSVRGNNGKISYMLTGYGDIPIAKSLELLKNSNYEGYISYEWVKRWSRELAEPGIAFYSYIDAMRDIIESNDR